MNYLLRSVFIASLLGASSFAFAVDKIVAPLPVAPALSTGAASNLEISALKQEIATLKQELAAFKNDVKSDISGLAGARNQMQADIEHMKKITIPDLWNDLHTKIYPELNGRINTLFEKFSALDQKVKTIGK